jgi:transglycosylase-like protein/putative peptidoglycan binding protein
VPMPPADPASVDPWAASLRRSRARRERARLAARWRLRRRGVALVLCATMVAGGGAALAAGGAGGSRVRASALLSAGAHGSRVAALQQALGIRSDGSFGARTLRSVRAFQRARGLMVDGVVGPRTAGALGLIAPAARSGRSSVAASPVLERIARCESGGDPRAVSAGGRYRGKYQFDLGTWRSLGGAGDPAAASEDQQDRMAARLLARAGTSAWPSCA